MIKEINITEMMEEERAILRLLCQHEGRCLSAEYLSERTLNTEMTDDGKAIAQLLDSLKTKLHPSGYTIRKIETLLTDPDDPDVQCEYAEYVFESIGD